MYELPSLFLLLYSADCPFPESWNFPGCVLTYLPCTLAVGSLWSERAQIWLQVLAWQIPTSLLSCLLVSVENSPDFVGPLPYSVEMVLPSGKDALLDHTLARFF